MKVKELRPPFGCDVETGEISTDTLGRCFVLGIYDENGKETRIVLDRIHVEKLKTDINIFLEVN